MRFDIGDVTVDVIVDLECFALSAAQILPGADLDELLPHRHLLAPDHVDFAARTILLGAQAMLVRLPGLTILVDTCVGEHKERPNRPDWHQRSASGFLESLAALGLVPEAIDIVFCTHLHVDHVGWNTRLLDGRWVPTFPKARYLLGRRELEHWQAVVATNPAVNHASFADSVLPILEAGLAELVDDGHEIAPGVTLVPLPGHTGGQMGLRVDRQGARAIFCGDAIHTPAQILRPEWSSGFCTDPAQARATRKTLLECAVDENLLLVPAHFRNCGCTRVRRDGAGFVPILGASA
jgi:glyoxylase-like metal-dependent hydrolase (beta-lactamase superfamily II)